MKARIPSFDARFCLGAELVHGALAILVSLGACSRVFNGQPLQLDSAGDSATDHSRTLDQLYDRNQPDGPRALDLQTRDQRIAALDAPTSSAVQLDCAAHFAAGNTKDGVYLVDPDGPGGRDPMKAYCDMDQSGKGVGVGWTLVLNYLHKESVDEPLAFLHGSLPLVGSRTLGTDESYTEYWGHAIPSLLARFAFTELRFYCTSDAGRTIHLKTSEPSCGSYAKTGVGTCKQVKGTAYTALAGHDATTPGQNSAAESNMGTAALAYGPLAFDNLTGWYVGAPSDDDDWGCDGRWMYGDANTFHQVWIR